MGETPSGAAISWSDSPACSRMCARSSGTGRREHRTIPISSSIWASNSAGLRSTSEVCPIRIRIARTADLRYKVDMETIEPGRITYPTPHGEVVIRCRIVDDQWVIAAVVSSAGGLTTDQLRAVPVGRLLAWLNGPKNTERDLARMALQSGNGVLLPPPGPAPDRDALHLDIPATRPKPDEFRHGSGPLPGPHLQRQQAALYRNRRSQLGPTPNRRGWVREARSRGFLPPGTKGAAR